MDVAFLAALIAICILDPIQNSILLVFVFIRLGALLGESNSSSFGYCCMRCPVFIFVFTEHMICLDKVGWIVVISLCIIILHFFKEFAITMLLALHQEYGCFLKIFGGFQHIKLIVMC